MYEITVIASSGTGEQVIKERVEDGLDAAQEIARNGVWDIQESGSFVFFPPQSITSIEALKLPEPEAVEEAPEE